MNTAYQKLTNGSRIELNIIETKVYENEMLSMRR